jgi:hypothetical protein
VRVAVAAASPKRGSDDRARVLERPWGTVVSVADGTGGMASGARAAKAFVDGVERGVDAIDVADADDWVRLIEAIDRDIAAAGHGGETTGVVLAIAAGMIVGASVGDSRAWLFTAAASTELTVGQQRKPRVGTGRAVAMPIRAGVEGAIVVATDGLFDHVPLADIAQSIIGGGEADALLDLVRSRYRTLPDDVAIVTVLPSAPPRS